MLTKRDREVFDGTGNITPDRLRELRYALRGREIEARAAANAEGVHPHAAAALRGKASAYQEISDLLLSLLAGNGLKKPSRLRRARHAQEDE